jgi:hypothetical protein
MLIHELGFQKCFLLTPHTHIIKILGVHIRIKRDLEILNQSKISNLIHIFHNFIIYSNNNLGDGIILIKILQECTERLLREWNFRHIQYSQRIILYQTLKEIFIVQ